MRYVAEGFRPDHWAILLLAANTIGLTVWWLVGLWREFTSTDDIDELVRMEER